MAQDFGIATLSLGSHKHHRLQDKLEAAAAAGFATVELFDEDWWAWRDQYAAEHGLCQCEKEGDSTALAAATALGDLVEDLGLRISCMQPLRNFEGLVGAEDRAAAREHALGVLRVMPALGTDLLLCCTSTAPASQTTSNLDACAQDLGWLADQAARLGIRIMYEALSFATHRTRWQEAWQVVAKANRSNLGLCCDSFNILARTYADPYSQSGVLPNERFAADLDELVSTVPMDKIYLYQIADASRATMDPPTDPSVPHLRPWSRSNRLFPLETELGAYLPVERFTRTLVQAGYKGLWSLEVFNDSLSAPEASVPGEHAQRGMTALLRLRERVSGICSVDFRDSTSVVTVQQQQPKL